MSSQFRGPTDLSRQWRQDCPHPCLPRAEGLGHCLVTRLWLPPLPPLCTCRTAIDPRFQGIALTKWPQLFPIYWLYLAVKGCKKKLNCAKLSGRGDVRQVIGGNRCVITLYQRYIYIHGGLKDPLGVGSSSRMMMIGFTTHLSPARHLVDVTPTAAHPWQWGYLSQN